jgi:hypothetical protein
MATLAIPIVVLFGLALDFSSLQRGLRPRGIWTKPAGPFFGSWCLYLLAFWMNSRALSSGGGFAAFHWAAFLALTVIHLICNVGAPMLRQSRQTVLLSRR